MGAPGECGGVEVRFTAELGDPLGGPQGVLHLLGGVLGELRRHLGTVDARGRDRVPGVPQPADHLGGDHVVQDRDHFPGVQAVRARHRALGHLLPGLVPDPAHVDHEVVACHAVLPTVGEGRSAHVFPTAGDVMPDCSRHHPVRTGVGLLPTACQS